MKKLSLGILITLFIIIFSNSNANAISSNFIEKFKNGATTDEEIKENIELLTVDNSYIVSFEENIEKAKEILTNHGLYILGI